MADVQKQALIAVASAQLSLGEACRLACEPRRIQPRPRVFAYQLFGSAVQNIEVDGLTSAGVRNNVESHYRPEILIDVLRLGLGLA